MKDVVQTPTHFVWAVEGKAITIHLDFGVVDRIASDVMRGFGAVPKRGAEVGGILLGSFEEWEGQTVVKVQDFELVACDYLRGPSYLLTENDESRFAESVARAKTQDLLPVGFFRSHTRKGFGLADEDVALFEKYFGQNRQVILLVRPFAAKTSLGGFFIKEGDEFHRENSYREFPFRRKDLGGGNPPPARISPPELPESVNTPFAHPEPDLRDWIKTHRGEPRKPAELTDVEAVPVALHSDNSTANLRKRWVWVPLSLVFLVVGVVTGFQIAMLLNRQDVERASKRSFSLGLTADWENDRIAVRWDRESAPIQNAQSGSLRILDGQYSKMVALDERQLRNGSVLYMSADNRVSFRLEVNTRQGTQFIETANYIPDGR
ncbi:MAG: hypothetical protein K7J46_07645 [Bryobacter sp.]|jgi:hypothetical protein|nr:hypothetical protein [Bryobacter sp. CoA8 C33]